MKAKLQVIKADGSSEEYLYTKVMGTISNALGQAGAPDILAAEQLADVITYTLYNRRDSRSISSDEILSVIKAVLCGAGYDEAAILLNDHHLERKLKRSRIEVISIDMSDLTDAERFCENGDFVIRSRWEKSRIVTDLVDKHGIERVSARAVASMVEQKVFSMDITQVPASLIKQLVLNETAVMLRAQRQLQSV